MPSLSVAMIVRNEEATLGLCLASVVGADEIVVVDTGSEDDTVRVAREAGARVESFAWCDDFAAARNYAIQQTTHDWVFVIDADEVLQPGGIEEIRAHLNGDHEAYFVGICGLTNYKSVRVMKRHIRYAGPVHETPQCTAPGNIPVLVTAGYSESHKLDPDRNLRILLQALNTSRYPRHLYYLAKELISRKQFSEAITVLNKYLAVTTWLPELGDAWLMKARCLWATQHGDEARLACLRALDCNANHREAASFMAEIVWPKNARVWRATAEAADNTDVLFTVPRGRYDKELYVQDLDIPDAQLVEHARTNPCCGNLCSYQAITRFAVFGDCVDVGCDHGALTYLLAEQPNVRTVLGVDIYAESLVRAERLRRYVSPQTASKVTFMSLDITEQQLHRQFDTLTCFHTLEHFFPEDLPKVLAWFRAVLQPGGKALIVVPNGQSYRSPNHLSFWEPAELADLFSQAGFTPLAVEPTTNDSIRGWFKR